MEKSGRNDPCHCGSGKKYKKCCLVLDQKPASIHYQYEVHLQMRRLLEQKMMAIFSKFTPEKDIHAFIERQWRSPNCIDDDTWQKLFTDEDSSGYFQHQLNMACLMAYQQERGPHWRHCYLNFSNRFTSSELAFLKSYELGICSYFQIKEIYPEDIKVEVEDIFDQKRYLIYDKGLSESAVLQDMIPGLLVPYSEATFVMEPLSTTKVDPMKKTELNAYLNEPYKNFKLEEGNSKKTIQEFLKETAIYCFWYEMDIWCQNYKKPPPVLLNQDKHKILYVTASYMFSDREDILSKIEAMDGIERDSEENGTVHFVWLNSENIILGNIELTDKRFVFKSNSKERFETFKKQIDSFSLKLVDVLEEGPESYLKKVQSEKPSDLESEPLPEEVLRKIGLKSATEFYDKWINETIPALDGKKPKDAVKTKSGKEKVEMLIDSMENHWMSDSLGQGSPNSLMRFFNADILREKLGILK